MKYTKDWTKVSYPTAKIERMEAFFSSHGFSPHRHDTYALGITLNGVHSFSYQKSMRHSMPGNAVVIHPDELHDGEAGTVEGFHYKILYIPPEVIQQVLGGKPLPFIPGGISSDQRIVSAISNMLTNLDFQLDSLEEDDGIYDIAQALNDASGKKEQRKKLNYKAAESARQFILDATNEAVTMDRLEQVSDTDRWCLSRDFRALFGTSPYRYLSMRRLDKAKSMISTGMALVDVAAACGFTDQSHMTHHFSKAYGLPPGRWADLILRK
ncbi:AraC family transcriptional regulator [Marinobacter sp. M3C]|jgi:AraC-like DNA-binding protein|uniref:helix-turn-helix domain-containing protein n=1 Tax=unclassified Marinobacter TaxID=83889 RepID=UPI00200BCF69|nr:MULTISPECIES: AraC family transcriptional regulator [unclassified Marinobacter]MCL1476205.1 AraC family transcriptional regulator [Marinobacter sp.]MCL1482956.1 AraC family transcriptional regulator [Marinobacter sp.]MCL1488773.1 AraC family transcriptional regulator [Marinobacter sp.]UQG58144.1 AraC family transcriptional regulator [Marinobacter sp. M4C]UQG60558.1 AraC family transcriptional regulator [Marinobacter sp. M3C]